MHIRIPAGLCLAVLWALALPAVAGVTVSSEQDNETRSFENLVQEASGHTEGEGSGGSAEGQNSQGASDGAVGPQTHIAIIPEPGQGILLLAGGLLLVGAARRNSRR